MPHDVPAVGIDQIVLLLGLLRDSQVTVLTKRISGRERLVMVKPAALLNDLQISWHVQHRPERPKKAFECGPG